MKKILIIYPHYPPSNLAGVHRTRLFAQHLPAFGWEPIILTVDEKYYEEELDPNLAKLLPKGQRIEKVKAFSVTKPRLIGDIGLRAFFQLRKKALDIIQKESIDFVYIPIPSFYVALIGQYLRLKTGVKYGIDYIDPWVHEFPGSDKMMSRHWWSTRLARWLEPKAVAHASMITGVAEGYYKGVQDRNPQLLKKCLFGAMPYGGEKNDYVILKSIHTANFLFEKKEDKYQFVYAGAMLPKAYLPLEAIFKCISANYEYFQDFEFHFIGTGKLANDPESYNLKQLALKYQIWETVIFEYPKRLPYLDVLIHLDRADAIFILGSTEPHYTPSKTFQGVLSGKPLLSVLHTESTAVSVIRSAKAGIVLDFSGEVGIPKIEEEFISFVRDFKEFSLSFDPNGVNKVQFEKYSAFSITERLADLLDKVISKTEKIEMVKINIQPLDSL